MTEKYIPTQHQLEKITTINFLGSKDFPDILSTYNLDVFSHNRILAYHFLTIGFQSTGIKEGSIYLYYSKEFNSEIKDWNNYKPSINFCFRITNNSLIEKTRCTTSHTSIRNTSQNFSLHNDDKTFYHHSTYGNTREFKNFLIRYSDEKLPLLCNDNNQSLDINKEDKGIQVKFRNLKKTNKIHKYESYYNTVIVTDSLLQSFLQYHFLSQSTKNEQLQPINHCISRKNKI